jgi:hypothetical protein
MACRLSNTALPQARFVILLELLYMHIEQQLARLLRRLGFCLF